MPGTCKHLFSRLNHLFDPCSERAGFGPYPEAVGSLLTLAQGSLLADFIHMDARDQTKVNYEQGKGPARCTISPSSFCTLSAAFCCYAAECFWKPCRLCRLYCPFIFGHKVCQVLNLPVLLCLPATNQLNFFQTTSLFIKLDVRISALCSVMFGAAARVLPVVPVHTGWDPGCPQAQLHLCLPRRLFIAS